MSFSPAAIRTASSKRRGDVDARSRAAFDAFDPASLERFFQHVPKPNDQVIVTAGVPYHARLAEMDFAEAPRALSR